MQEIHRVAAALHGYVGADIAALVAEAVIAQLDVAGDHTCHILTITLHHVISQLLAGS